jgi:hypothetical protein
MYKISIRKTDKPLKMYKTKFKIINLLALVLTIISCNKDIELIKSKDNYECRRMATYHRYDDLGGYNNYGIKEIVYKENLPYDSKIAYPILKQQNIKLLEDTSTMLLKNNSKTKVYEIRIQKENNDGRVSYEDFKLEPTEEICLGCDSSFDLDIKTSNIEINTDYYSPNNKTYTQIKWQYEGKIKKIYDQNINIHSVKLISEY